MQCCPHFGTGTVPCTRAGGTTVLGRGVSYMSTFVLHKSEEI